MQQSDTPVENGEDSIKKSTTPVKVGGRKAQKYRANTCLNCQHPLDLSDVYCAYCSQLNSTKKLTVGDFFEELFSSIISYDSRFRQSLKTLIFRPGVMSREFVNGKRMKYVNPFRFYLSISILFFVVFGLIQNFDQLEFNNPADTVKEELENGLNDIVIDGVAIQNVRQLDSIIKAKNPDNSEASLESILNLQVNNGKTKDTTNTYVDKFYNEAQLDTMGFFNGNWKRFELYGAFSKETQISRSGQGLDSLGHVNNAFHRWVYKKAVDSERIGEEPGQLLDYFTRQLPFVIFFFIPIFALFVSLLYIRRKAYTYTDHMIFLFHTQTMFFVLYGVAMIIDLIFGIDHVTNFISLLFLFYLYKAMRNFYKQRRFKTIVKFLILNFVFFILAIFGAVVAFAISFATY